MTVQVDTTEAFLRCKAAYEVLSNQQRRSEYDQQQEAEANPWQVGAVGCSFEGLEPQQPFRALLCNCCSSYNRVA
jgi:DnaJ-class molecular chaperone